MNGSPAAPQHQALNGSPKLPYIRLCMDRLNCLTSGDECPEAPDGRHEARAQRAAPLRAFSTRIGNNPGWFPGLLRGWPGTFPHGGLRNVHHKSTCLDESILRELNEQRHFAISSFGVVIPRPLHIHSRMLEDPNYMWGCQHLYQDRVFPTSRLCQQLCVSSTSCW